jgi:hypothetical protein
LTLRSKPDPKSTALRVLGYGARVQVLADAEKAVTYTTGNISGHWTKVSAENDEGYVFDGYLSRWPAMDRKQTLTDYLKGHFKVSKSVTTPPDASTIQYEKIEFVNGLIFEFKLYEGGSSNTLFAPETSFSFKELYLLARINSPEFFEPGIKTEYKSQFISWDDSEGMRGMKLEKKDGYFVLSESAAD